MSSTNLVAELPFEPLPEALDTWFSGLPNDPGEYRRALKSVLQTLACQPCESAFQQYALERLRPIVLIESHRLTQSLLGKPGIRPDKARKLASLGVQFANDLGKAYLQAVRQQREIENLETSDIIQSVHRGLECFELYALRLAMLYEHCPASLWQRLFELYGVAESLGQTGWKPEAKEDAFASLASVEGLLIRLLTFRLSAPNQLNFVQIQKLHELLRLHGSLIRLSHAPQIDRLTADFSFDIALPGEPQPYRQGPTESTAAQQRFLFLEEFRTHLSLLSQHSVNEFQGLDDNLAAHLQVRLSGMPAFQLESRSRDATLITEFDDIVTRLSILEVLAESPEFAPSSEMSLEILPIDYEPLPPAGFRTGSKSAGTFEPLGTSVKSGVAGWSLARGEYPCQVRRAEAPGFYLLEPTGTSVRPDALLAINTDNKLIQLGVAGTGKPIPFQLLASEPATVNVYLDSAPLAAHKAILGHLSLGRNGERGLFVKSLRFRCGEVFTLERNGSRQRVKVVKVREVTPDFAEFEIAIETL